MHATSGLSWILLLLVGAEPTLAPSASQTTIASSSLDTNHDGKVDEAEVAAAIDADAGINDVIHDISDVQRAVSRLHDPNLSTILSITLLLSAIFKLLLSGLKLSSILYPFFQSQNGKRALKYSTLGLGAAAALMANLSFGMSLTGALMILLSGPLAVAIHEYTSDVKSSAGASGA